MNVLIVSALYIPEPMVSAVLAADLAEALHNKGCNVTVICPNPSRGIKSKDWFEKKGDKFNENLFNEVRVVRIPSFTSPESKILRRSIESWSFGVEVIAYLRKLRNHPDVVYVNAWPILAQWLVSSYLSTNSIPFVLQIMDLYPESLINRLPKWISGMFFFPLYFLDRANARRATYLSVISHRMELIYVQQRKINPKKVAMIPTWHNQAIYEGTFDRKSARRQYGLPCDIFTFLYLGNIGPVAGVEFVIQAFGMASIQSAQLVIVGEGSRKQECMKIASSFQGAGIYFISDPESANSALIHSMADIVLLPVRRGAAISSIPSKLAGYMLSAKPVLATVDEHSDTARIILEADCGWVGPPEDISWLSKKMLELLNATELSRDDYGQRGRDYACAHFTRDVCLPRLANLVLSAGACRSFVS